MTVKKLDVDEVLRQGNVRSTVFLVEKVNELVDIINKIQDNKPVVPRKTRSKD